MPYAYSRTVRSIEIDVGRLSRNTALFLILFCVAWMAWFALAKIDISLDSVTARVESDQKAQAIQSSVDGRIEGIHVELGQTVDEGDVIVTLDTTEIEFLLEEQKIRNKFSSSEVTALKAQIAAEESALVKSRKIVEAVAEEGAATRKEKSAALEIAETEATYSDGLVQDGYIAELAQQKNRTTAEQRRAALQASSATYKQAEIKQQIETLDREARIAELRRELAISAGQVRRSENLVSMLEKQISDHTIRSPVRGTVGELGYFRPQTVIARGDSISTLVPASGLKVIAFFEPESALGRIRTGDKGIFRSDAYSWVQYGSIPVTVHSVSSEVNENQLIRVELSIDDQPIELIALQHGLPGTAKVIIDRTTPFAVVLRLIGKYVS